MDNLKRMYTELKTYQQAAVIYDFTVEFCDRYVDKTNKTSGSYRSRMWDQMVQAARSGKQNITEGCSVSKTSPKNELFLLGVARGSLKELLEDYRDFLRQRNLREWGKDDPRSLAMRQIPYRTNTTDMVDRTKRADNKTYTTNTTYQTYLDDPEQAANAMITLISQTNYLLDQQMKAANQQMDERGVSRESHEQRIIRIKNEERRAEEKFWRDMEEQYGFRRTDRPIGSEGRIAVKAVLAGVVVVFATVVGITLTREHENTRTQKQLFDIRTPLTYTEPLVIASMGNIFSVRPINASASAKATADEQNANIIRYTDAYPSTDVEQVKLPHKLKESLILKDRNHPERFEYQLNMAQYVMKRDGLNNLHFYPKGKEHNALYKLFTIPAPFMIDAAGRTSNNRAVETTLTDEGVLVLKPSKEWLAKAVYPVILDPTVEINVLNIQSYPVVGGEWEVRFTTQGTADLAVAGLTHDDFHTVLGEDVEFVSLKCGDEDPAVEPSVHYGAGRTDGTYRWDDWSCDDVGYFTVRVLRPGKHHLQFNFGGAIADAYNDATGFTDPTGNGTGSNCTSPTSVFTSDDLPAVCNTTQVADADTFGFSFTSSAVNGIEVRLEWKVSGTSADFTLSCQLLDATGTPTGNAKTDQTTSQTDITTTLGSAADMWGTSLTEANIEDADFGVRCTATKNVGGVAARAQIDNIDVQITYTAGNNAPTITSAADTPDPTNPGRSVTFITDWNDADSGETVKIKICKTNSLTGQNCDGGFWATSTAFTTADPESLVYDVVGGDAGQTRDYWAFVCDDGASCSAGTAGSFSVNSISVVPDIKVRSGTKVRGGAKVR